MALMLYMSGFTINLAVRNVIDGSFQNGVTNLSIMAALIVRPAFRDLIISLLTTYGSYLVISLLYFDPWHMLTSFVQYLLLLPSFTNILMVYAFCNLHGTLTLILRRKLGHKGFRCQVGRSPSQSLRRKWRSDSSCRPSG
jgi:hypothetical protein